MPYETRIGKGVTRDEGEGKNRCRNGVYVLRIKECARENRGFACFVPHYLLTLQSTIFPCAREVHDHVNVEWSSHSRPSIELSSLFLFLSLFLFTYAKRFPRGISSTTTRRDKFVRGKLKDKMTKLPAISYLTYLLAACNFFLVSTWMNKFIKMLRWFAYTTRKI